MKAIAAAVLTAAFALTAGAVTTFAAGPAAGRYFTDANGDGICDRAVSVCLYAASGLQACPRLADGQDSTEADALGRGFIDEDSDGVCDRYEGRLCPRDGNGCRNGCGRRGR